MKDRKKYRIFYCGASPPSPGVSTSLQGEGQSVQFQESTKPSFLKSLCQDRPLASICPSETSVYLI